MENILSNLNQFKFFRSEQQFDEEYFNKHEDINEFEDESPDIEMHG